MEMFGVKPPLEDNGAEAPTLSTAVPQVQVVSFR
jgi:hypothetical protein